MKKEDYAAMITEETIKLAELLIITAFSVLALPIIRIQFPEDSKAEILHVQHKQMFSLFSVLKTAHEHNKALSQMNGNNRARLVTLVQLNNTVKTMMENGKFNVYVKDNITYLSLK